ncbi:MAG: NTP transferase domain-containing protein [Armatimonadetes bacterium]|nr:NTP transferase domain-containing protein [Armatimonadota bacterium]
MTRYAALVTAGGRLSPELSALCGTPIKALAPLGDRSFIEHVCSALRASGIVETIAVVGSVAVLQNAGIVADLWVEEGETLPENLRRAIAALREAGHLRGEERLLLCATDAVFLHADTVRELSRVADEAPNADIVFPLVREADYERAFPQSPNVYAPLAGERLTGSSVQIVRPAAIERSLPYIERAFAARKSQWQMARLLGAGFVWRFVTRTLTVADAVKKVESATGLQVHAPILTDARVAADVDSVTDYEYAKRYHEGAMTTP